MNRKSRQDSIEPRKTFSVGMSTLPNDLISQYFISRAIPPLKTMNFKLYNGERVSAGVVK